MSKSSKRPYRQLEEVVPLAIDGFQANFYRNPACENYGVPPVRLIKRTHAPTNTDKTAF